MAYRVRVDIAYNLLFAETGARDQVYRILKDFCNSKDTHGRVAG